MLPPPSCTFKIPSLHDDIELSGRIYFPRRASDSSLAFVKGFAILAHPYAPLGGSFDDPVVHSAGSVLLRQGFLLTTFNFRGATGSTGSTSWTGKAELGDYVSIYALLLLFMNAPDIMDYVETHSTGSTVKKPLLILGGYSYGSMITSHLPDLNQVCSIIEVEEEDSSENELRARATELSKSFLGYAEGQMNRGRSSLRSTDIMGSPTRTKNVMLGGYESDAAGRRVSRESSRRSIDVERVRHSIERVRNRLSTRLDGKQESNINSEVHAPAIAIVPSISYLLISPLLPPVSVLTTFFTRPVFEPRTTQKRRSIAPSNHQTHSLAMSPTLAVYGTKDAFTSARKLQRWSSDLEAQPGSRFASKEVTAATHFWHDEHSIKELQTAIQDWLAILTVA